MRTLTLPVAALVLAFVVSSVAAGAASARVPHTFVGVFGDGPLLEQHGVAEQEYDAMVRGGAGSVREVFSWWDAQPYVSWSVVPDSQRDAFRDENGIPTDWKHTDRFVARAARRRLKLLPVVQVAPRWAARTPSQLASSPSDPAEYARFLDSLVDRYGPEGSFWAENPDIPPQPIRDWQLWNEPYWQAYWHEQPYERDYVELLRVARAAIRAADPGARVVLAGLANESWMFLRDLYRAGARPYFDVIAIHPYTTQVPGLLEIIGRGRRVARRFGDIRKPLMVTEMGWTSGLGRVRRYFGWEVSERRQAEKVTMALRLLAGARRRLRMEAIFWYTWASRDQNIDDPFDFAGLNRLERERVVRKPAFRAFRRTALRLVGCPRKAEAADRCAP
jgi:hypothetical protein